MEFYKVCIFDENCMEYESCERPLCNYVNCIEHEEFDFDEEEVKRFEKMIIDNKEEYEKNK